MAYGPNTLSASEKALGWELLFDGENMDQWRLFKGEGTKGWQIKDGVMTALGLEGLSSDIVTKATFDNFEFSLEWKISEGGNSGIFFNVSEEEHLKAVYYSGPEYQLLDLESYIDQIETWQMTAANYAMHAPKLNVQKPRGEWNHSRLIVDNGSVQHWLNDRLVVSYKLWTPEWEQLKMEGKWKDYPDYGKFSSGHIALQDHGGEIGFRNIKIRRLPDRDS